MTQNNELQLVCNAILGFFPQSTITPDEFTIHVTGNNPIPPSFDGSTTPVLVTLGPGDYEVTETAKASVQATVDLLNTLVPKIFVTGPTPTFSGDCEQDQMDPEKATGTIAEGDSKTCNKNNEFQVDFRPS